MIRIERASLVTPELCDAMARLLPQLNPSRKGPSLVELEVFVANPAVSLLIAFEGSEMVGTATLIVYPTVEWLKGRIESVVVDEAWRGRGVGEALVRTCLDVARHKGAKVVELQSARRREAANRLYPRMGFELRESNVYRMNLS